MAHKQKYYKNIDVNGHLWRLEIWQDTEAELTPKEIGPVLQSLRIAVQGSQADVDTPIVKTSLEMSFIDAPGYEEERKCGYWEEFYTSAATEYLVKLYKDGQIEWSGYVTPDSFEEDLRYRGSVSIIARDNLGYLQDFKFRMHTDDGLVDLNTLLDEAKKVIDFQMDVLGAQLFPTSSNGGDLRQVLFNIAAFRDKTWWEVLESAFYSVGVTMRYVGRNSFILAPIREQSKCGYADYEDMPTRETRFLRYGHRELVPAAKSVIDECEFDILESLVEIYSPDYQFGGQSSLTFVETSQGLESGSYSMPVYEYASQSAGVASAQAGASRLLNPYNYKLRAGGADAQQKSIHSDDVLYALSNTIRVTSYEDEQTGIVTHDYYFQKVNPVVFASKIQQGGVLNMSFTFERPVVLYPDGTIGDFIESQYGERLFLQALGFKATWEGDNGVKKYLYHATLDGGWSDTDNGQVVTIPSGATEFFTNPVTVALPSLSVDGPGELRIEFYGAYFPTTVNRNGESHQGAYIRITAADIMLAGEGAVHAAKNSKTTTNYNSKNNLLIQRSAELAPNPNRPLAPQMIVNNIMVQDTTGVTGAMNWTWGLGYEDMPLSVMIHKQLLCYHAQPMDLLSGELVSDDCTFDSLYTWNGKEYSLLSGSLNVLTGRIEGAVLREFMRYENLWNEIDTRVRTFALPRSQEQTEDYKTSYRYEDKQKGGMASSPDGSGYVTKKYADETYAPIALVSGVSSRLATIETYFSNAEDVDTQINKWNEIVAFLDATEGTTLAGILATYATKDALAAVADSKITISGLTVGLGGSITQASLRTGLGLDDLLAWYDSVGVNFQKHSDGTFYVNGNLVTKGQFAASLVGQEGGGGGVMLLTSWPSASGDYSGYALGGNLGVELNDRVKTLEGKATAVSFSPSLTSGKQIGVLTIDGVAKSLYAPSMYDWSEINAKPTRLSQFTDDVVAGNYLPLSGGTISGQLILQSGRDVKLILDNTDSELYNQISIRENGVEYAAMFWTRESTHLNGIGNFYYNSNILIHSGNYSDYALPLSGGTMSGRLTISPENYLGLVVDSPDVALNQINLKALGELKGIFQYNSTYGVGFHYQDKGGIYVDEQEYPRFVDASLNVHTLLHSGNIGSQSVAYASNAGTLGGYAVSYANNSPWGTIPVITLGGWMDVGRSFEFHYDNETGSDYSTVLTCTGNYANIVNLPSASGTLALTTDNVASASYAGSLNEYEVLDFVAQGAATIRGWHNWGNPTETSFANYTHGIVATSLDDNVYHYLGFANAEANPRVRSFSYGADSGWKKLAFVDDNVASAQSLAHSNGTVGATVTYGGNVLINTGNDDGKSGKLLVGGGVTLRGYAPSGSISNLLDLNGVGLVIGIDPFRVNWGMGMWTEDNGHGYIQQQVFNESGTTCPLCLNPFGGNVGIGLNSPNTALHVRASSHLGITVESSTSIESSIVYKDSSAREWVAGIGVGAMDNSFGFWTNTNLMTVMSLLNNGNVLIGTRDDNGKKLQVNGGISASAIEADSISSYDNGTGYFVGKRNSGLGVTDGGLLLYSYDNTPISLFTYGSERVRITGGGNVGIGIENPQYKLDVNGILRATAANFGGDWGINIGMTYADNTSGAYDLIERKKSGYSLYFQYHHNGHLFMCQGGGNVLIGATTDSGYKFDVYGTVRATDTIYANNGINIGGIRIYAENGVLKIDGDLYTSGQFASGTIGN